MNYERWGFVVYWQDDQWTINQVPAVILASNPKILDV